MLENALTRYSDNHKVYKLVDVETNIACLSCDMVVDKRAGLFQATTEQKLDPKIVGNEGNMAGDT
jgi:hypothetical protein